MPSVRSCSNKKNQKVIVSKVLILPCTSRGGADEEEAATAVSGKMLCMISEKSDIYLRLTWSQSVGAGGRSQATSILIES